MNSLTIKARSIARRAGLLPLIQRLTPSRSYEAEFGAALLGAVRLGDVVWDVGANVGHYTRQFIEKVGPTGSVVAFEPEPTCCEILRRECREATVINAALSGVSGQGFLQSRPDDLPLGDHHMVEKPTPGSISVQIFAGDDFGGRCPNVIKIDVEGFEEEVLTGMPRVLANRGLRAIFLEVHFALLEQRDNPTAPIRIQQKLRDCGFTIKWLPSRSHLQGTRDNSAK